MGGASTARLDSTGTVVLAAVGVLAARFGWRREAPLGKFVEAATVGGLGFSAWRDAALQACQGEEFQYLARQ